MAEKILQTQLSKMAAHLYLGQGSGWGINFERL